MARKLFTFLGTGDYKAVRYGLNGKNSDVHRYACLAIADILGVGEAAPAGEGVDKLYVIATDVALTSHWEEHQCHDGTVFDGLGRLLARDPHWRERYELIRVKDQLTEEILWDYFDNVVQHIQKGDEILVDITHGMRSQPVTFLSIVEYMVRTREATLKQIIYGAYDAPETEPGVKQLFDLSLLYGIRSWTESVFLASNAGDFRYMHDLSLKSVRTLAARQAEATRDAPVKENLDPAFHRFIRAMRDLSHALFACRSLVLHRQANAVQGEYGIIMPMLKLHPETRPLQAVTDLLIKFSDPFCVGPLAAQLAAIEWALKYGYFTNGFIYLREAVFTWAQYCLPEAATLFVAEADQQSRVLSRDLLETSLLTALGENDEEDLRRTIATKADRYSMLFGAPGAAEKRAMRLVGALREKPEALALVQRLLSGILEVRNSLAHAMTGVQLDDTKLKASLKSNLNLLRTLPGMTTEVHHES